MSIAITRLQRLPVIFTGTDFCGTTELSKRTAAQTLWRWSRPAVDGSFQYIQPLGGKSDVYFNLVRDPDAPEKYWEMAVLGVMPGAIMGGHLVLKETGVSTQFSRNQILVSTADSVFKLNNADVMERRSTWIKQLRSIGLAQTSLENPHIGITQLPRLNAGAAIADLVANENWSDFDEIDEDRLTTDDWNTLKILNPELADDLANGKHCDSRSQKGFRNTK